MLDKLSKIVYYKRKKVNEMKFFKWFKVNGEDREFMYLFGAPTKQEVSDFLNEFRQHYNSGDLYKITGSDKTKHFVLWDSRQ